MPRLRQPPERDACAVLAGSADQVSGSGAFREPERGQKGRGCLGILQSLAAPPQAGVSGGVVPHKKASDSWDP